jgi:cephalosporin-C deacetylase-like acetyl esterase
MMKILKRILIGFVLFLLAVLLYLIVLLLTPILPEPKQPLPRKRKERDEQEDPPSSRQDAQFYSEGQRISAWLYLPPEREGPVPCVVMTHGFGGTKDALLERYALRFVQAGTAVLTFDYRHFGESEGEPRQLYDISYQLDDLRAAITYARRRPEIDPEKIIIWSTSASGGYGLVMAGEDARIAALIAQCAGIDHEADGEMFKDRYGIGYILRLFPHAQRDKGRSRFGLSPHRIPIVGQPGTTAVLSVPGVFDGYARLLGESETFRNEVCARLLFMEHGRDPNEAAQDVHCPALFLVCEEDNIVAPNSHVKAAQALGDKAVVRSYPIGHFDIYEGHYFEKAVQEMLAVIARVQKG